MYVINKFRKKFLLCFLFSISLFIVSCAQINDEIKYKDLSTQELIENRTKNEKKINTNLFYRIISYKKLTISGESGSNFFDNLKKNPLVLINDKNQIYIKIRLSTRSLIEGYEVKQEIEKLGCQVVEVHSGYKKFVEINTWTDFESL